MTGTRRTSRRLRSIRRAALALALALVAAGAAAPGAGAQTSGACTAVRPCVMMIQIDGLEAADLTPGTTPFLWGLAHPDGDGDDDGVGDGGTVLDAGRSGWIWQAPRASMTAGLASNAAAFLSGGYPEQIGIPADEFVREGERIRLGGSFADPAIGEISPADFAGDSLFRLIGDQIPEARTAAFAGDPNLGQMVIGPLDQAEADIAWYPTPQNPADNDPQNPFNPALCDLPRDPTTPPIIDPAGQGFRACAASDEVTLARAFQDLSASSAGNVLFTYIELAELGHIKRSSATVDQPGAMDAALHKMDAALGAFLSAYINNGSTQASWDNTILMINGTSGYESTPTNRRVPDPDTPDQDLANDVGQFTAAGGSFRLIPQGTLATVYSDGFSDTAEAPSEAHRTALAALKARIESANAHADCQAAGGCIEEVLYLRPELTPNGSLAETVQGAHPGWHLDHLGIEFDPETGDTTTTPTGQSGELLVVMRPGWGAGKAVPTLPETVEGGEVVTNPYQASTGGPRNRAVASLINGFGGSSGVRSLSAFDGRNAAAGPRYPVSSAPEGTAERPECRATGPVATPDVGAANAQPGDDADAPGHECQAETLDFAPTVAALLQVAMPPDQIGGRILQEAFIRELALPGEELPPPEAFFISGPVTPPAGHKYPQTGKDVTFEFGATVPGSVFECSFDGAPYTDCASPVSFTGLALGVHEFCIQAISPTAQVSEPVCAQFEVVDIFDFDGLLRDLRAHVADYQGKPYGQSRRGRRLNRIALTADYGRPNSAVTLTLYRQKKPRPPCGAPVYRPHNPERASAAACSLTGIARFKPFRLGRGHIALRLKVPGDYRPTHLGLTVREVVRRDLTPKREAECRKSGRFFCFWRPIGSSDGGIVRIVGASRLHTVKGRCMRGRSVRRCTCPRNKWRKRCRCLKAKRRKGGGRKIRCGAKKRTGPSRKGRR